MTTTHTQPKPAPAPFSFSFRADTDLHHAARKPKDGGRFGLDAVVIDPIAGVAYATNGRVLAWASVEVQEGSIDGALSDENTRWTARNAPRHPEVMKGAGGLAPNPCPESSLVVIPQEAWKEIRKRCKGSTWARVEVTRETLTVALPGGSLSYATRTGNLAEVTGFAPIGETIRYTFRNEPSPVTREEWDEPDAEGRVRVTTRKTLIDPSLLDNLYRATRSGKHPVAFELEHRDGAWIVRRNGKHAIGFAIGVRCDVTSRIVKADSVEALAAKGGAK